ncbi:unnamed protein product [Paramecium pentaurelia]|uniref:AMP-activated protein kinase glycogen-binding domain-containing protein n=1 Tax=Paramecium pentaurelia TaxID=43138 RepID=A0A8S1SD03_9CILI|nr:unnamed protein product [Paramecium pentaurelia]
MNINMNRCQDCGNIHPRQPCAAQPVKFIWPNEGKEVLLFGSWNLFQVGTKLIGNKCTLNLAVGQYEYKFLVDNQWRYLQNQEIVHDNHGSYNNMIQVLPKRAYQIFESNAKPLIRLFEVADEVIGSWDNWSQPIKLQKRYNQFKLCDEYYTYIDLQEGRYEFIFKRGSQYFHDSCQPTIENSFGKKNNIMVVLINKTESQELDFNNVYWTKHDLLYHTFDHIYGHTMTSIGNSFYIFGGAPSRNEMYKLTFGDHQLNLEETEGEIPRPRAYHNALAYGDKILFFGGVDEHNILNDHFVYVTSAKTWYLAKTDKKWTERERASLTFYAQEELVILFGGYYLSPDLEVELIYNDVYYMNIQNMQWVKLNINNQPQPRYGHTAIQVNEKMYIFCGKNQDEYFNDIWMLNFENVQWQQIQTQGVAPEPRYGHTTNLIKSKICIFGGRNSKSNRLNDLHLFDFITNTWITPTQYGQMPSPRYFHAADIYNGEQLWILGGNIGLKRNEHFYIMNFGKQEEQTQVQQQIQQQQQQQQQNQ